MWKDPIVEETRSRREALARRFNYDIKAIGEMLRPLGVAKMVRDTSVLREELDKLSPNQKAELARTLIDSLDEDLDEAVEHFWLDEAARRYEAYRRGEMASHPAAEVFARVRTRLRQ